DVGARIGAHALVVVCGNHEALGALAVPALADHGHLLLLAEAPVERVDLLVHVPEERCVQPDPACLLLAHASVTRASRARATSPARPVFRTRTKCGCSSTT